MRFLCLFLLSLYPGLSLFAQEKHIPHDKVWIDHVYNQTGLTISPSQSPYLNGAYTIAGYKITKGLGAGLGIGFTRLTDMSTYDTVKANFNLLPVFAEVRYNLMRDKKFSPFAAAGFGYAFLINMPSSAEGYRYIGVVPPFAYNEVYDYDAYRSGGIYLTADAGVRYKISDDLHLFIALNYTLMQVHGIHHHGFYQHIPDENSGSRVIASYTDWDVMAYMHLFQVKIGLDIF